MPPLQELPTVLVCGNEKGVDALMQLTLGHVVIKAAHLVSLARQSPARQTPLQTPLRLNTPPPLLSRVAPSPQSRLNVLNEYVKTDVTMMGRCPDNGVCIICCKAEVRAAGGGRPDAPGNSTPRADVLTRQEAPPHVRAGRGRSAEFRAQRRDGCMRRGHPRT